MKILQVIRRDASVKRKICLYGYVRGTNLRNNSFVHVPGVGDLLLRKVDVLEDPCPLPECHNKKGRRRLNEKEQLLYAPFSGLGGVVYDKDAIYIDTGGTQSFMKEV